MAIFSPNIRLSKVDLPTLGRPTMATYPERNGFVASRLLLFSGSVISFDRITEYYGRRDSGFKMAIIHLRQARAQASLKLTPLMKKRLTRRAADMIENALPYFPELSGKLVTVGYTRKHLGSATVTYRKGDISRLVIRLRVRKLTYQTLGHELTHLIQGLAHAERLETDVAAGRGSIPSGEKPCDIWTLARHELFCDDAPTYLRLPRIIRASWPDYAAAVRLLCLTAIDKRTSYRRYIQWLEAEIQKLAQAPREKNPAPQQLDLFSSNPPPAPPHAHG